MPLRQRGAAQVSLLWLILSVVVAVVAILFAFLQTQEVSSLKADLATQRQAVAQTDQRFRERGDQLVALSKVVGFTGESATGLTSVDAVTAALKEAQNTFASAGNAATLESAVRAAVTDYTALTRQKATLESDVRQLRSDLEAKTRAGTDARRQADQRIAELERQLEDQRNATTTQVVNLERQRDDLRQQVRDKDKQLNELRARMGEMERRFNAELASYKIRNDILSEKLNAVSRRADQPDGHVLTVSAELGRAWIDLGRKDRVRPGMVFEVRDRLTGHVKGRLRILRTEDRRSETTILEQADRFNPVSSDDQVFNTVYDPERELVAVLRGNGFGRYSEEDLRTMLHEVGIRVVREITPEVDYLLIGTPFFDAETGEMVPWSSDEVYKAAQAASVQIVPFRDAMDWLGI